MSQGNDTTKQKKGKHLTPEERVIIQTRLKDKWSDRAIAREIGCSPSTIANEKKRGSVKMYKGHVTRYKAKAGQEQYEKNRQGSRRQYKILKVTRFIEYARERFREDKWSPDAIHGQALASGEFTADEVVCTKTLYQYVDLCLIGIKNIDLPDKLKRRAHKRAARENRRVLGRSIEERPKEIDKREEFGHWEADLVIGERDGADDVLLVLLERKSRNYLGIRLPGKEADHVQKAMEQIRAEFGADYSNVFRSITTDNGSEFSRLSEVEQLSDTLVYYAHPYASCEKGSIENHNRILRRFIPKGKRMEDYTAEALEGIFMCINHLPRKLLGYRTPEEVFDEEMDKLFAA